MSNYISNDNQRLLWKTAHQIPAFAALEPPRKEVEFKNVIEYIYRKCGKQSILSIGELQQLNRETLSVFLPKKQMQSQNQSPYQSPNIPKESPIQMVESRQDKSLRAFQERQDIYETMNKKPDLPSPEEVFGDKIMEDGKIQNMDELILQYQKQREFDFIPPPLLTPSTSNSNTQKKLKLLDETILEDKDVQDLSIEENTSQISKKMVSWKTELIQPPEWQNKIDSLENKIQELQNKNDDLERKMENITNHVESLLRDRDTKRKPKSPNQIHTILDEIIYKIEKMDNIKNKMKMFSV